MQGATRAGERRERRASRAIPALSCTALGMSLASLPSPVAAEDLGSLLGRATPQDFAGLALVLGLIAFATTTALVHLRERRRWARQEALLARENEELRARADRVALLVATEPQLLVSWHGRDAEPEIEGDTSIFGEGISGRRVLAFGSWLPAAGAQALERALERLKERGERFQMNLRATSGAYYEAEGRAIGGRAVLRLREVTGDRLDLLRHRDALAEARAENDALAGVLDSLPVPAWRRDAEGRLTWVNRAYAEAVEAADAADAVSRGLELLDAPTRKAIDRQRAEGTPYQDRVTAVVTGARRVLDVTETPNGDGSAGVAIDVSELEAVRSDLERQMAAHVRTLDQLPTAVAIFDASQRLTFWNAAYRELWQLDAAFLESGPTDGEVLDELRARRRLPEQADYRAWKADVLAAYRSIEPQEHWWYLPDGRTLRVLANPNPKGGVTYLFDDVSERFNLESRFNALLNAQGETLNSLREGVAVFGSNGHLKLCNPAFGHLWQISEDMLGELPHIDDVIRHCGAMAPQQEAWEVIRGAVAGVHDTRTGFAARMERRDGTVIDCVTAPLPDGSTLLTFTDVTASVEVERALKEKNQALEQAARLRDDFVHHVSYELRSPLTNIIGFVELLDAETVGPLNDKQREYASHITKSSAALLAIINDILDLASIDNGAMALTCEEIDIRETIDAALAGLQDRLAERQIRVVIDVPADIGRFVADAKRVRQVLFNLLSNAIGFSESGQTVTVSARREGEEVVFSVSDSGRGIAPEVRSRVFDRFESHTLGSGHRGVGLGLSIVRSFVELHGGTVSLDSTPGRGTTVTCRFPRVPNRAAAE